MPEVEEGSPEQDRDGRIHEPGSSVVVVVAGAEDDWNSPLVGKISLEDGRLLYSEQSAFCSSSVEFKGEVMLELLHTRNPHFVGPGNTSIRTLANRT